MITHTEKPKNAYRVTLTLTSSRPRIDQVLMEELRKQSQNLLLKNISRTEFKELFKQKKIRIKGQSAVPSSSLAPGTTFVDIFGFEDTTSV
jgi:23S rRNA-/tRNA-specific pseudouridylate synthase